MKPSDLNIVLSIRSQLAASISLCDALLERESEKLDAAEDKGCQHKNRRNERTMGQPEEWTCLDCGTHYRAPEPVKEGA